MNKLRDEYVSTKISAGAHLLLRYCPTLGVSMQEFASRSIQSRFRQLYPDLYEEIKARHQEELDEIFDEIIEEVEGDSKNQKPLPLD